MAKLRQKTEQEKIISNLIRKFNLPFRFIAGKKSLRGNSVDFIAKDKKKIIEVHNESRNPRAVRSRLMLFAVHGYEFFHIDELYFKEARLMKVLPNQLKNFYNS